MRIIVLRQQGEEADVCGGGERRTKTLFFCALISKPDLVKQRMEGSDEQKKVLQADALVRITKFVYN